MVDNVKTQTINHVNDSRSMRVYRIYMDHERHGDACGGGV